MDQKIAIGQLNNVHHINHYLVSILFLGENIFLKQNLLSLSNRKFSLFNDSRKVI